MIDLVSDGEKGAMDNSKDLLLDNQVCGDIIRIEIGTLGWGTVFTGGHKELSLGHIELEVSSGVLC